ncbi:MAG: hypothetical protein K2K63_10815, partial [Acetatifactor sp.]|nr:hypothetical protein [Acetatifactor sp.]
MKSRYLGKKLKRALVMVLTVALLASDNAILYAAGADAAGADAVRTAGSAEVQQESVAGTDGTERQTDENTIAVSGGDAGSGTVGAEEPGENDVNIPGAVEVTPGEEDTSDTADNADASGDGGTVPAEDPGTVSGGDAASAEDPGTVSGGDAAVGEDAILTEELPAETRLPEQFYEEEKQEAYGTLVSFDEYSRTYHVDGNQYVTVVGNDGATFIDDDGNLMPVDNTLERETASVFGMFGGEQEAGYVNRANDYMVLLPENPDLEEGRGITIANRDALITLYPAEGSFQNGLTRDNAIRYSNVFPGVDYQYTVLGNSVKEDIILLEQGEKSSFSYFIDTNGLAAEIRNNTLYLYEAGTDPEADAVFVLEAPEMIDSVDEISFGVRLSMEEQQGMVLVTVTADESWLSAPERVYPVRIDPTAIQVTGSAIRMACAEQGSPNTVIGDNQYPYVGYDDGVTSGNYAGFGSRHLNCRTYFSINYDFASLMSEAEIVSAAFQVTQKTRWSKG